MFSTEINAAGNYDTWKPEILAELRTVDINDALGNVLIFENPDLRFWKVALGPGERLPFRLQNNNYSWSAITDGLAVSRFADGTIKFFRFNCGDTGFFNFKDLNFVCDFENIGEYYVELIIVEYLEWSQSKNLIAI